MNTGNSLKKLSIITMAIGYAISIFYVSIRPFGEATQTVRTINNLSHIPAYAVLTFLVYLFLRIVFKTHHTFHAVLAAMMVLGFGIVIELCQIGIPGRQASVSDVFLNVAGIAVGLYVVTKLLAKYYPGEI